MMSDERAEELTRQERTAFGSLSGAKTSSRRLENRIVSALAERGLLQREPWWLRVFRFVPPAPRLAVAIASILAAFVVGVEYGKRSAAGPAGEAVPEVRLDSPDDEAVEDMAGTMVASSESDDEAWTEGVGKPDLASLGNGGYGAFPPFPLEGRDISISPKYR